MPLTYTEYNEMSEYLKTPRVQQLLEQENMFTIYHELNNYSKCTTLTKMFYELNIDPIQYGNILPPCSVITEQSSITLPENITVICSLAFCECPNLTDIYLSNKETEFGDSIFGNGGASHPVTIHYPGTIQEYEDLNLATVPPYMNIQCEDGFVKFEGV